MRYTEFKLDEGALFEIKMSPSNLSKLASKIDNILIGLEFEMLIPGVQTDDSRRDVEFVRDDSMDERIDFNDFAADVRRFFTRGEAAMSSREAANAISQVEDDYYDWLYSQDVTDEQIFIDWLNDKFWDDEGHAFIDQVKEENPEISDDEAELIAREQSDNAASELIEEGGGTLDSYVVDFRDEGLFDEIYDMSDWGDANRIRRMSDLEERYDFSWPYYAPDDYYDSDVVDLDSIAHDVAPVVGRRVDVNYSYHSKKKSLINYTVEPDASLEPNDGDDAAGVELVSPPMTINEIMQDFYKIVKWAKTMGAYTNQSCGLHTNVSVPAYNLENLDYAKMVLLLGDEHVSKQFDRLGNGYATSSLEKIRFNVDPSKVPALFDAMKSQFNNLASQALIHAPKTEKMVSVNLKDNRIELRSPGGDWINKFTENPDIFLYTMLRTVVAMDAALDPEKYRKEYLTKLYKLFASENSDTVQLFAQYVAGEINAEQLKIKWARMVSQQQQKTYSNEYFDLYNVNTGERITSGKKGNEDLVMKYIMDKHNLDIGDLRIVPKGQPLWDTADTDRPASVQKSSKKAELATRLSKKAPPIQGIWEVIYKPTGQAVNVFVGLGNHKPDAEKALYRWAQAMHKEYRDYRLEFR